MFSYFISSYSRRNSSASPEFRLSFWARFWTYTFAVRRPLITGKITDFFSNDKTVFIIQLSNIVLIIGARSLVDHRLDLALPGYTLWNRHHSTRLLLLNFYFWQCIYQLLHMLLCCFLCCNVVLCNVILLHYIYRYSSCFRFKKFRCLLLPFKLLFVSYRIVIHNSRWWFFGKLLQILGFVSPELLLRILVVYIFVKHVMQ